MPGHRRSRGHDDRSNTTVSRGLSTLLLVVVIVALLMVVIVQQMQIERIKQTMAAEVGQRTQKLANIIREQRDYIERHKVLPPAPRPVEMKSQPGR